MGGRGLRCFLNDFFKSVTEIHRYDWNKFLWLALADIPIHEYNQLGYGAAFVLSFLNLDMEDK